MSGRSLHTSLARSWHRLAFRWRRAQFYRELAEELEFHSQLKAAENRRAGMSPESALALSRKQMGNITIAKEECRDMWSFMRLERLWQDLHHAARMFARTPVFTAVAILSLALGIGGNAAMFSLVNTLLIRPLPYSRPESLYRITGTYPRAAIPFLQQRSRSLDIAAVSTASEMNLTRNGLAIRIVGSRISPNFLSVLGASVAKGRSLKPGEDLPGRDGLAIISHSLWKERLGSDPAILDRVIALDGVNREIVGIMPAGFSYPSAKVQIWIPMRLDPSNLLEYWAGGFVPVIGRLRPGATVNKAREEIRNSVAQFRKTFPYPMARDWNANVTAISLQQDIVGDLRSKLIILLSSVGMVLLIACANVAGLLLSRAAARRKEIALRGALGAGRLRILRQLLTESVALALVGAGIGIILGMSALSIFKSVLPPFTPGLAEASIDWHVAAAVTVIAVLAGLAFGLAPALSAQQTDLTETIKAGSPRSVGSAWTQFRSLLITGEIALTLVLVVSAGLLLRSLYRLSEANPGFNPAGILTVEISPDQFSCTQRAACVALYDRLLARVRNISGVADAAIVNSVPLDGQLPTIPLDIEGHPKSADYPSPMLWFGAVTPDYLRIMHIPLLAGREFTSADGPNSAGVVLISASTAKHFWPGENPIGKHLKLAGAKLWRTVIGVVGDVDHNSLTNPLPSWIQGAVYMPYGQSACEDGQIPAAMTLLVRPNLDNAWLRTEIRQIAEDQAPNVPVGRVRPLQDIVSASIADFRSTMRVFITFAGAALLLAAIGIYGLLSYWVTQRTYEIGLRIAIGATRRQIVALILHQGMRITMYGVGIGLFGALILTRFLRSLLYGVGATDVNTYAEVAALILGVALAAAAVPAWRAARIDPAKSLRVE
ncbi:MAG: ABC transporter permease [Acidobacteriaceae bacterium]|nr:ABC transporter permease [Acidobacteriaceae bacterium]MBV9778674.1 ABC transporter permease [Acidobacteriaceae bacterium]